MIRNAIILAAAFALAAMPAAAQSDQDHQAHHPAAPSAAPAAPEPPRAGGRGPAGMMGGQAMPMMQHMMGGQQGRMPMMSQGGMGMMGMMGGMAAGPGAGAMRPFDRIEGRLAFLKAELAVTATQEQPWKAFADAVRAAAKRAAEAHRPAAQDAPQAWPDRIERREAALAVHLDALRAIKAAARDLYAALSDAQKKTADELMAGPLGFH